MDQENSFKWNGIDSCVADALRSLSSRVKGNISFTKVLSAVRRRGCKATENELHNVLVRMRRNGFLKFCCKACAGRGVRVVKDLTGF